jgi:hypothetical protein
MLKRVSGGVAWGLWLVVGASGCGGDDGGGSGTTGGTEATGSTSPTGVDSNTLDDAGPGDASQTASGGTTNVDSTGAATTDPSDSGATDTGLGDCQVWEITYDLEGSTFEISGTPLMAGDQVNTVTMPYDADDHVGPGTFVLRFQDVGGAPGGLAAMVAYTMSIHFVIDSGVTTVATDIEAEAGPDECGLTVGNLAGTTVAWAPPAIVGTHSMGQVLCTGALCGAGGLPNGDPVPQDETSDQLVSDFVFSEDLSSFTMAPTVTGMDANSTQTWTYAAVETSRELVIGPTCLCR